MRNYEPLKKTLIGIVMGALAIGTATAVIYRNEIANYVTGKVIERTLEHPAKVVKDLSSMASSD